MHAWQKDEHLTSMKGQSVGEDLTALGGSLTEVLLLRLPSVMAWALGMALSLPKSPGELSFSSPSPAVLELLPPISELPKQSPLQLA